MATEKTTEKKAQASKKADATFENPFFKGFEQFQTFKGFEQFPAFKGFEQFASLGKENMDAAMKASALFAKGAEVLNAQMFAVAREAIEENLKASKAAFGCKTPDEFFELQNDLARANYEKAVAETRKLTEMSVKVAEESAAPLTERVNANVEVLTKNLAA